MKPKNLEEWIASDEPAIMISQDYFEIEHCVPDKSIKMIMTDVPYNINQYSTGNMNFDWRSTINNDIAEWDEDKFDPKSVLESFKRILADKGNIFSFTGYNQLGRWHDIFDSEFDTFQMFYWHKTNPIPNVRKSSFLNSVEQVVCLWNKGHTWNFSKQNEMHNMIEGPICMGNERLKVFDPKKGKKVTLHPTQKPEYVLKHLIELGSNEGDIIFDPFGGVFSTGAAALKLNRRFIGIEIEDKYYTPGKDRILQNLLTVVNK